MKTLILASLFISVTAFAGSPTCTIIDSTSDIFTTIGQEEIISVDLKDNQLIVVKKIESMATYMSNPPNPIPDEVWKEVYGVVDGKIKLIKRINGRHIPRRFIEETYKFEE